MNEGRHNDDTRERERERIAQLGAWARSSRATAERLRAPSVHNVDGVRELGSVIADRYVLKEHIGRGCLGDVYRAVDRGLSDPQIGQEHSVVLQLVDDRLSRQTRLLQKLENSYQQPHLWAHPNVVKVCGFGCDLGRYFLVTELLEGVSLRAVLDEIPAELPAEAETLAVLRAVGDALKYAHAKGAIHGDIRPEKIFITNERVVKVLDLLPASPPRTEPFFLEDAQPNGLVTPDQRDDVYGLACLAYELFAGRHPFNASSPLEALNAGLTLAPIRQLSEQKWNAIARGLALRREQRTTSVAAFVAELGITGEETLRPRGEPAAAAAPPPSAPVTPARARDDDAPIIGDYSDAAGAAAQCEPSPSQTRLASRASEDPWLLDVDDLYPDPEPARRRGPRRLRLGFAAFVVFVAAAAAATYWSPEARTRSVEWLAVARMAAENALSRATEGTHRAGPQTVDAPPIPGAPPDSRSEVAKESPAATASEASDSPVAPKAATPESLAAGSRATPAPAAAVRSSDSDSQPPPAEQADSARRQVPVAVAAEPVAPESFEFASQVVYVSEAQASAAVQILRRGGDLGRSSVVWWTSDGSASADHDYVGFGATIERFAEGETARTIHIPIVGDSIAEGREDFYVNLRGRERPGHLEPVRRIRIVITDD